MRRLLRGIADTRGTSLLELQVALIILQVVFLMAFAGFSSGVVVLGTTSRDWESQAGARSSLQLLSRNLRQATQVATADANQIGFYADLDNDGIEEAIVYRLTTSQSRIERAVNRTDADADGRADGMPTTFSVFLPSVVNTAGTFLTYYNSSGAQIASGSAGWPATIRAIGFEVLVDIRTNDRQAPGRYQTIVQMRNVGFRAF